MEDQRRADRKSTRRRQRKDESHKKGGHFRSRRGGRGRGRECVSGTSSLDGAEGLLHFGEHLVRRAEGDDGGALLLVVLDHGFRVLVEGRQALLDGLLVVVDAAGGLGAVQEALDHDLVGNLEVQDLGAGQDLERGGEGFESPCFKGVLLRWREEKHITLPKYSLSDKGPASLKLNIVLGSETG